MKFSNLFSPLEIGPYALRHRVVMAPLTRTRAGEPGDIPRALNVEYYQQCATPGGLIIAEGSPISETAKGMPATPGIYSPEQVKGWEAITEAVHAQG